MFFLLPYTGEIWFYRALVWVAPVVLFFIVRAWCRGLQSTEQLEHRREEAEEAAQSFEEDEKRLPV